MRNSDSQNLPRLLFCLPIIHTQADLGAMGASIKRAKVQKLGQQEWERQVHFIDQRWNEIAQVLQGWQERNEIVHARTRLYQDGLPVCEWEEKIVREMASAGSRNHQLLLQLHEGGAMLMGTESPQLLLEEYQLVKESLQSGNQLLLEKSQTILQRRDQFIATRINDTLQPGETGILFLGLLHSVEPYLAADIQVSYPIHQPLSSVKSN